MGRPLGLWLLALAVLAGACRGGGEGARAGTDPAAPASSNGRPLSLAAQVGRRLFFDKSLSASGAMSCATCHDPAHAYGPPNSRSVQLGGRSGAEPGLRAVPSLRYTEFTPPYADLLDNPDGVSAPGPGGGFAWDGRAATLAEQARMPLLSPVEMANASPAEVVTKVAFGPSAAAFQAAFPEVRFNDTDAAFKAVLAALQSFQLEDPSFHPYSSKFDLHADNKIGGELTAAETRGYKVFLDPKSGNCVSCHYSGPGLGGSSALFTDFSYEALGVPRNRAIAANDDAGHFDLGLCGPPRGDHRPAAGASNPFCGLFKTPTLRNVATRSAFFHNGVIRSLEQAVRFYNTRDTNPELWYPTAGGVVQKFDDLPVVHRPNIDGQMPLDGRPAGAKPPMTERNIADLICFLETLNDGYQPPSTPPRTGRCVD